MTYILTTNFLFLYCRFDGRTLLFSQNAYISLFCPDVNSVRLECISSLGLSKDVASLTSPLGGSSCNCVCLSNQVSIMTLNSEKLRKEGTYYPDPSCLGNCSQGDYMSELQVSASLPEECRGLGRLHALRCILLRRDAASPSNVRPRALLFFRTYSGNCSRRQYHLGRWTTRLQSRASYWHRFRPRQC